MKTSEEHPYIGDTEMIPLAKVEWPTGKKDCCGFIKAGTNLSADQLPSQVEIAPPYKGMLTVRFRNRPFVLGLYKTTGWFSLFAPNSSLRMSSARYVVIKTPTGDQVFKDEDSLNNFLLMHAKEVAMPNYLGPTGPAPTPRYLATPTPAPATKTFSGYCYNQN